MGKEKSKVNIAGKGVSGKILGTHCSMRIEENPYRPLSVFVRSFSPLSRFYDHVERVSASMDQQKYILLPEWSRSIGKITDAANGLAVNLLNARDGAVLTPAGSNALSWRGWFRKMQNRAVLGFLPDGISWFLRERRIEWCLLRCDPAMLFPEGRGLR